MCLKLLAFLEEALKDGKLLESMIEAEGRMYRNPRKEFQ